MPEESAWTLCSWMRDLADEEALNQAMKALYSLAEGQRMVGIISHVSELKERISRRITVTKNRKTGGVGSTVQVSGES